MMLVSAVAINLCLIACIFMIASLPSDDPNVSSFYLMGFVFLAASLWSLFNVYNLFKKELILF